MIYIKYLKRKMRKVKPKYLVALHICTFATMNISKIGKLFKCNQISSQQYKFLFPANFLIKKSCLLVNSGANYFLITLTDSIR
jgi:hypothetical protein